MKLEDIEHYTNLEQEDLEPELFAAALALQHIYKLIANGGSEFSLTYDEDSLHPNYIEAFLKNAVEFARTTKRFENEWGTLQRIFPQMRSAWKEGQVLFQIDLARATINSEDMGYLSLIDFAVDCYARISAQQMYPDNKALQAWAANGYMVAWKQHFL